MFYAKDKTGSVATLRVDDFRNLSVPEDAGLSVTDEEKNGKSISFTVTAAKFAHAVHFGLPASYVFSDQYFDLLPGESRRIVLTDAGDLTPADISAYHIAL